MYFIEDPVNYFEEEWYIESMLIEFKYFEEDKKFSLVCVYAGDILFNPNFVKIKDRRGDFRHLKFLNIDGYKRKLSLNKRFDEYIYHFYEDDGTIFIQNIEISKQKNGKYKIRLHFGDLGDIIFSFDELYVEKKIGVGLKKIKGESYHYDSETRELFSSLYPFELE